MCGADNSPLWTAKLKAELGVVDNTKDGLFWMSFVDFVKYFNGVNVCRPFTSMGLLCLDVLRCD